MVDLSAFARPECAAQVRLEHPRARHGLRFLPTRQHSTQYDSVPTSAFGQRSPRRADGSSFTVANRSRSSRRPSTRKTATSVQRLSWSSDRDGVIGSGATVSTSSLTVGVHTITASVTDSGGLLRIRFSRRSRGPVARQHRRRSWRLRRPPPARRSRAGTHHLIHRHRHRRCRTATSAPAFPGRPIAMARLGLARASQRACSEAAATSLRRRSWTRRAARFGCDFHVVNVDNLATADVSTTRGTISSGSFQNTWTDDDVYEVLTEAEQGGNPAKRRNRLEHTWRFNVAAGSRTSSR